jgi:hypothetical protein
MGLKVVLINFTRTDISFLVNFGLLDSFPGASMQRWPEQGVLVPLTYF